MRLGCLWLVAVYFEQLLQYKPKNGITLPPEKEMVFAAKSFLLLSYKRLKFACLYIGNHFIAQFRFSRHFEYSTGLVARPAQKGRPTSSRLLDAELENTTENSVILVTWCT